VIVFKIRNKTTGEFINKSGHCSEDGSVFTKLNTCRAKINEYKRYWPEEEYEIVKYELREIEII
jgi:hypothetical protein